MSLVWDWWKLFMSLNLKNVVCTISKGIALSHENYRVRHLPAVLLIYMWKGREGRCAKQRCSQWSPVLAHTSDILSTLYEHKSPSKFSVLHPNRIEHCPVWASTLKTWYLEKTNGIVHYSVQTQLVLETTADFHLGGRNCFRQPACLRLQLSRI